MIFARYGQEMTMMAPRQIVLPPQEQVFKPMVMEKSFIAPLLMMKAADKVAPAAMTIDPNVMFDKGALGTIPKSGDAGPVIFQDDTGAVFMEEPSLWQKLKPYLPLIGVGVAGLTVVSIILLRK